MNMTLEEKPKAFIKREYQTGDLPDANPYKFSARSNFDRSSKQYREASKMVNEFLNRPNKGTPLAGSKISF